MIVTNRPHHDHDTAAVDTLTKLASDCVSSVRLLKIAQTGSRSLRRLIKTSFLYFYARAQTTSLELSITRPGKRTWRPVVKQSWLMGHVQYHTAHSKRNKEVTSVIKKPLHTYVSFDDNLPLF